MLLPVVMLGITVEPRIEKLSALIAGIIASG